MPADHGLLLLLPMRGGRRRARAPRSATPCVRCARGGHARARRRRRRRRGGARRRRRARWRLLRRRRCALGRALRRRRGWPRLCGCRRRYAAPARACARTAPRWRRRRRRRSRLPRQLRRCGGVGGRWAHARGGMTPPRRRRLQARVRGAAGAAVTSSRILPSRIRHSRICFIGVHCARTGSCTVAPLLFATLTRAVSLRLPSPGPPPPRSLVRPASSPARAAGRGSGVGGPVRPSPRALLCLGRLQVR